MEADSKATEFRANWFAVDRAVLDPASLGSLHRHALDRAKRKTIGLGDSQVADAPVAYGDRASTRSWSSSVVAWSGFAA